MRGLSTAFLSALLISSAFVVVVALMSDTLSVFAPFVPMRSLLLAGALALTGGALGLSASSYGERIAFSSSAKAAAPFAAPFVLLAGGSAAALSLAMAAATERL